MLLTILLGLIVGGAAGGWVGWKGRCTTGACPFTSNPYLGAVAGAMLGVMAAGIWARQGAASAIPDAASFVPVESEEEFDKLVREMSVPVLVDFWAAWCPPCRAQGEILNEMAGEFEGHTLVAKVDVDRIPSLAARYGIRSIPTLMLFEKGSTKWSRVGVHSKELLRELLTLDGSGETK